MVEVAFKEPVVPRATVLEVCKPPDKKIFLQRAATVPKSSVASVSDTKLVLMATEARLDKAVLAPATIQAPEASSKQPLEIFKPLAKVDVTEFEEIFKTLTVKPPWKVLVEPLPYSVEVEVPPMAR